MKPILFAVMLWIPLPEPAGPYTDAEAEAFAKTLAGLNVTYPANVYDVMKKANIDPTRLGKVEHLVGNATDWYRFPLSPSYHLIATQRLPARPSEKGVIVVDGVDVRKRQ